jgi:RNA polymerase sigma-70 factor (ECF subfamily)
MLNEEQLLERAQTYDAEALAALYDRYAPLIYTYLYRRVQDAQTAEDLTGDVFLSVLEAINSDKPWRSSFRAWLYRIAGNKATDYFRKHNKERIYPEQDGWVADDVTPDAALIEKQSRSALQSAIQSLAPRQQEVLALRFGQRLKTREVADIMGKTVGAVEALQNRALKSLRKKLNNPE